MSSKIAIIVDLKNWALWNNATSIQKNLPQFKIDIYALEDYANNHEILLQLADLDYDLLHFQCPGTLNSLFKPPFNKKFSKLARAKLTCSVHSHTLLEPSNIVRRLLSMNCVDGYTVCSKRLYNTYKRLPFPTPSAIIPEGVDSEHFFSIKNKEKRYSSEGKLMLGWVGNPEWGQHLPQKDYKGYHLVFKPLIERLKKQYNIEALPILKSDKITPLNEMNQFYNKMDLFLCTSCAEGTPHPVLEAMACGVPVISTNVGIIPEVFGQYQSEFIIPEQNVELFYDATVRLLEDPLLRKKLSEENKNTIQAFSRKQESIQWFNFFNSVLNLPHRISKKCLLSLFNLF